MGYPMLKVLLQNDINATGHDVKASENFKDFGNKFIPSKSEFFLKNDVILSIVRDTIETENLLMNNNEIILKRLGRINNFYDKDQEKPSATLVISGDIFKIYFDENVDLNLIKENLVKRQNKYQEEMDKISQRLSNKGFTNRAPKNIVEQEKTNYSNLKNDIKKISLTIESL